MYDASVDTCTDMTLLIEDALPGKSASSKQKLQVSLGCRQLEPDHKRGLGLHVVGFPRPLVWPRIDLESEKA